MTVWRRHALGISAIVTETELRLVTNKLSINETCIQIMQPLIIIGMVCSISEQAKFNILRDTQSVISEVSISRQPAAVLPTTAHARTWRK